MTAAGTEAAPPAAVTGRRPRRLGRKLLALGVSLLVSLLLCEAVLRWAGGYTVFALRLERRQVRLDNPWTQQPPVGMTGLLSDFLAAGRRADLDPAWFEGSPPPVTAREVLPEHREAFQRYGIPPAYYRYNRQLLTSLMADPAVLAIYFPKGLPERVSVFEVPGGALSPPFRYPPSTTMPTGLTVNALGFRGPEIEVDKAPRTVRIACVGASTTVNDHRLTWSYPELLQHWLQQWVAARGSDIRVEVVNAGREAFKSPDIASVVRHELVPLAVDYVVYYEGANQFLPFSLFRTAAGEPVQLAAPPPGILPSVQGVSDAERGLLDTLAKYSATAERLRSLLPEAPWLEPEKPPAEFRLPDGFDEQAPPLDRLDGVLDLPQILGDLEQIRQDCSAVGANLVLCTFVWLAKDGMVLEGDGGRIVFATLNSRFWPLSYADVHRAADLQNRVFARWAAQQGVDLIDVAARMPFDHRLFTDPMHNTQMGVRVRGWCVFERLTEVLARDLAAERVPVPDRALGTVHPNQGAAGELVTGR